MEWDSFRKKFRGARTIEHKKMKGRRLDHKTYAFLYNEGGLSFDVDGGPAKSAERIEVELFQKAIFTLYPNNDFIVNNHGFWRSECTKIRFRQLFPYGGYASRWGLGKDLHHGYCTVWTMSLHGYKTRPWKNDVLYDYCGRQTKLPAALFEYDASEVIRSVQAYAKVTSDALKRGEISTADACGLCRTLGNLLTTLGRNRDLLTPHQLNELSMHMMEHVQDGKPHVLPVALAMTELRKPHLSLAAALLVKENRIVWKKATTNKQIAERVRHRMFFPELYEPFCAKPAGFGKDIERSFTQWLLEQFGFTVGWSWK